MLMGRKKIVNDTFYSSDRCVEVGLSRWISVKKAQFPDVPHNHMLGLLNTPETTTFDKEYGKVHLGSRLGWAAISTPLNQSWALGSYSADLGLRYMNEWEEWEKWTKKPQMPIVMKQFFQVSIGE